MADSKAHILTIVTTVLYALGVIFALIAFGVGILWFLGQSFWILNPGNLEQATYLLGGISAGCFALREILNRFMQKRDGTSFEIDEKQAQRNRKAMLQLVKTTWVEGVLKKSLYSEVLLSLGMEEKADAVANPWDMVLKMPDKSNRLLASGTKIIDVFDEMNQHLLILGEPGSGKTTMLLELARDAINRAERNPESPIPVVFNLSTWSDPKQSLSDWLIAELIDKYRIPKKIALSWVEKNELLLLLDGLDEVAYERREACVDAINAIPWQILAQLTICSRIADYEALNSKLKLLGAVVLQPLTDEQIDRYLNGIGAGLETVRIMLKHDAQLQELARSPLMLGIMTLAYRGESVDDIQSSGTLDNRRRHLFDAYIKRMFNRVGRSTNKLIYEPVKTTRWVKWMANNMLRNDKSVFLVEDMQPNFLHSHAFYGLYCLTIGLFYGLAIGLISWSKDRVFFGIIIGFIYGMFIALRPDVLKFEQLRFSWSSKKINKRVLLIGILSGMLIGVVFGLTEGLVEGVVFGVLVALAGLVESGRIKDEIKTKIIPNQGIRLTAKNAWVTGVVFGLLIGLVSWSLLASSLGVNGSIMSALISGLIMVLISGVGVAQHYSLRLIFFLKGYIPWNLVLFLDYATERIFLRRVGGGYIFIHRLLMEHFASLTDEQITAIAQGVKTAQKKT